MEKESPFKAIPRPPRGRGSARPGAYIPTSSPRDTARVERQRLETERIKIIEAQRLKADRLTASEHDNKAYAQKKLPARSQQETSPVTLIKQLFASGYQVNAMKFSAFLVKNGIYSGQNQTRTRKCTQTRTFRIDLISYLKEPSTRQSDFDDVKNFIEAFGLYDDTVTPTMTYNELLLKASAKRGFKYITSEDDDDTRRKSSKSPTPMEEPGNKPGTTDGTEGNELPKQSEQTTESTPKTDQMGTDHGEDPSGSSQYQAYSTDDEDDTQLDVQWRETIYRQFRESEGQDPLESHFRYANGKRYSDGKDAKLRKYIHNRFDADDSSINPNKLRYKKLDASTLRNDATGLYYRTYQGIAPNRNPERLIDDSKAVALLVHQALEGIGFARGMKRSHRVGEIISHDYTLQMMRHIAEFTQITLT